MEDRDKTERKQAASGNSCSRTVMYYPLELQLRHSQARAAAGWPPAAVPGMVASPATPQRIAQHRNAHFSLSIRQPICESDKRHAQPTMQSSAAAAAASAGAQAHPSAAAARIGRRSRCISRVRLPQALPGGLMSLFGGRLAAAPPAEDSEPRLLAWMQQRGFAPSGKLVAQQLPGQGRGLVAAAPVRQGELVLQVPQQLVVFPETAAAESVLAPLLAAQPSQLPDWSLLVLWLAEQRHHLVHGSSGSSSAGDWRPYLESLPPPPLGTVLDWQRGEVEQLLAGSGLLPKARTILAAADALWGDLCPLIDAGRQQGLAPPSMFARADIDWAVGICLSRSVRLDDRRGEVVLVPYADLLNHDVSCEAFLVWDAAAQAVVLRPDRAYAPGQQVFISYGPKSSGELLLSYGFCPAPGSNPHDAAFVSMGLPVGGGGGGGGKGAAAAAVFDAKRAALAARGIPEQESWALRIDALPAGLLPYAAFAAAQLQVADEAEPLAAALFDDGELPALRGVSCEQVALEAIAAACKQALQGYSSSADADRQLAAAAPASGGGFEQRRALMAAVRLRERQILSRTEFVAQQRVRQLRKGGA